jgi:hypothetical protein
LSEELYIAFSFRAANTEANKAMGSRVLPTEARALVGLHYLLSSGDLVTSDSLYSFLLTFAEDTRVKRGSVARLITQGMILSSPSGHLSITPMGRAFLSSLSSHTIRIARSLLSP